MPFVTATIGMEISMRARAETALAVALKSR
jgi:hypothetical protein